MKLLILLWVAFSSIGITRGARASQLGVYGPDDREELDQVTDPMALRLADSSVALFSFLKLGSADDQGRVAVHGTPLQSSQNLCEGQPFEDEPTAPYCSGVLVAPDVVMTAGHCINWFKCLGVKVAFGYAVHQPGVMPDTLAASDVYSCAGVIHSQSSDDEPDFALIRLDRPVTDHAPLELDRASKPAVGDSVFAIGYPNGLPLKVAGNATVREVDDTDFTANLDMFEGNSGSPVFDARTGLIEGILVEGGDDFVKKGSCNVIKRYPNDGGPGETSTSVSAVIPYLPKE